ncbi:MAG: tripartite tricarboxylate transporter substrate binding protein [Casimicrobiaceae bacterium]
MWKATLCTALFALVANVSAQTWPARPIQLVIPYAPGGVVDFIGRTVGQRLSTQVGQPVVVDNRPGAGGIIGVEYVARSAPDGQTMVLMDPAIVINPSLQEKVPYDLKKDLQAVAVIGSSPLVLVVNPSVPVTTLAQLIDYARANPGKLNFVSAGIGTTPHMAGELLKLRAAINMTHVPYKGSGPAMSDLVGGQVQIGFSSITAALPFIQDNRLRPLATTGSTRSVALPEVPTVIESGYPGFEVDLWLGIFAPANVPAPLVAKLNAEIGKALEDQVVRAAFAKAGVEPRVAGVDDSARFVRGEFEKWANVVRDANLKEGR